VKEEVEKGVTATPESKLAGPVEMRVGTTFIVDLANINVSARSIIKMLRLDQSNPVPTCSRSHTE
jgi:hypothetical protein